MDARAMNNSNSQRGSVLVIALAGIATLGVMAVMGSTLISTLVSGNQRSNLSISTGQILTQAAYTITTEANTSGSYPIATVPTAWSGTNPTTAPTIGTANAVGLINAASAAPKVDAWGSNIGYCTFTAVAQGSPVFAVISAGPDKTFQTTCTQAFAGTPQGDDGVRFKTAANVLQGVGGTVYFGDPVANLTALEALTTAKAGEMRSTKDTGYVYVNKTGTPGAGNWTLSGGGGTAPGTTRICTAGYVAVPAYALPDGTFVDSFCVMQYEARNIGGLANADVTAFTTQGPWVNITQIDAKAACNAAGANLIGENQWLSITHQAVSVASNWSGGAVGSGTIARGWSANTAHGDTFTNGAVAPSNTEASCLYNTGANTCGAAGSVLYRRTLNLPNGNAVWDISGNVWEWTDATLHVNNEYMQSAIGWYAYNAVTGDIGAAALTPAKAPINKLPPNNWNAVQGMGRYYDLGTDRVTYPGAYNNISQAPDNCTGYCTPYAAFLRGGAWSYGAFSGPFALNLDIGRSSAYSAIGFRCTR